MKCFFVCIIISIAFASIAQSKLSFTACIEAGLAKGGIAKSGVFFFSNGVSYKNISAGIGAGIDDYTFRSISLFFDVKKEFGKHKVKPFVDASAGINIPNPTAEQKRFDAGWYRGNVFKNGFFAKASMGISVSLIHRLRFFIDAGYSYKTTSLQYNFYASPDGSQNRTTDIYHFNRWFAAIGFQL